MNWLKRYKKLILESALVIGLVTAVALAGNRPKAEEQVILIESKSLPAVEPSTETVPATETEPKVPQLTEKQSSLVSELETALQQDNLTEAARILIEKEQQFVSLYYTTMEGRDYLYQDGVLSEKIEGEGLVFQKPGTLFYGSFQNGSPQGDVLALQAIKLEAPRYDYSIGTWKEGYLEGNGTIGYCYYEGTEGSEPWEVKKEGTFVKDLMEGPLLYTSKDREGTEHNWNMNALQGVTVLDDSWTYEDSLKAYQLLASEDDGNAYVINESEKDGIRWMNLIPWAR